MNKTIENLKKLKSFHNGSYGADIDKAIKALEQESVLDKIMEEIEQVKSIMNEEIINNNRKDLINFVNGLNQSLIIIERYKTEGSDKE